MNRLDYLLAANIIIWAMMFGYLGYLQMRYARLKNKVEILLNKTLLVPHGNKSK